ncbi:hypothetical protein I6N96_09000 [Enterococcus sp. BWM-S5]|uniref:Uncharacterized protein n=1 Tax=Enterococcus larvae TaxID=2794352 RepID=A0ABS4CK77_9ENTE|nr:hypothetical protein [Enterococcus larvae]MBP1046420.1 hypothetical protein [Enterococcus larvae]
MKVKHLLEVLEPNTTVIVSNFDKYSLAEVDANMLSEFPFDELEIKEIETDSNGTVEIRLEKF